MNEKINIGFGTTELKAENSGWNNKYHIGDNVKYGDCEFTVHDVYQMSDGEYIYNIGGISFSLMCYEHEIRGWNELINNCPFCGEEAELFQKNNVFAVRCKNKSCPAYGATGWATSREKAVKVWNSRV